MVREHPDIPAVFVNNDVITEIQAQPNTQPGGFVVKKGSNILDCISARIPGPSSSIPITTHSPSWRVRMIKSKFRRAGSAFH